MTSGSLDQMETSDLLNRWLHAAPPDSLVVYETFTINDKTAKKSPQPASLELIGAARYLSWEFGIPFELQRPFDAKSLVTNDRLKQLRLWRPGQEDHERDALRHLVRAMALHRIMYLLP